MSDLKTRLEYSLNLEDEAFLKQIEDEDGLFSQMGATFAGRMGPWTVFAFVFSLVFFGVMVWSVWQLLNIAELKDGLIWLAVFCFSNLAVGLIKIWFWMRMNHLAVMRDIKRLELRIARLDL